MHTHARSYLLALACLLAAAGAAPAGGDLAKMKFDEVRQVAPGVFFRFSSISAGGPKGPFGGCNNIWIVIQGYVVVLDPNFPKEAGDGLAAIPKTYHKTIRPVLIQ